MQQQLTPAALSTSPALLRIAQRQTNWWIARSCADASWSGFETSKVRPTLSEKNKPRFLPILAQRDHVPRLLLLFFRCDVAFKTRESSFSCWTGTIYILFILQLCHQAALQSLHKALLHQDICFHLSRASIIKP